MLRVRSILTAGAIVLAMALACWWPTKTAAVPHVRSDARHARVPAPPAGAHEKPEPAGRSRSPAVEAPRTAAFDPTALPEVGDPRLQRMMLDWATRDPAAAIHWLARLPASDAKNHLVATVGLVLALSDLDSAIALAGVLPRGGERRWLVGGIVRLWSQRDPNRAAIWIASLPEGLERSQAERVLADASQ